MLIRIGTWLVLLMIILLYSSPEQSPPTDQALYGLFRYWPFSLWRIRFRDGLARCLRGGTGTSSVGDSR
jgi:hypothetical protein